MPEREFMEPGEYEDEFYYACNNAWRNGKFVPKFQQEKRRKVVQEYKDLYAECKRLRGIIETGAKVS